MAYVIPFDPEYTLDIHTWMNIIYVEFEGNGFRIEIYPLMRVVQIKDNYLIFDLLI